MLSSGLSEGVLIGGTTDYDANDAALLALMDEWNSAGDYKSRVAHLTGKTGGLNGSYFLTPTTVHDDKSPDLLVGGIARDLFFKGLKDDVLLRRLDETLMSLN